jgi:Tol biopolymer transport system component
MRLLTISSLLLLAISAASAFAATETQPKIFEPGIVSGPLNDGSPTFSPDEKTMLFTRSGAGWSMIVESHRAGNGWSQPELASFSGEWSDMQPVFSPDGSYLIYASNRPAPPAPPHTAHLWRVDRKGDRWSDPTALPDTIHISGRIFKPSIASDGSLYFMSMEKDQKFRLFRAEYASGSYQKPEPLPFSDGTTGDVDPEIAPDGSYLIFSSNGRTDGDPDHEHLFIVMRNGNAWGSVIPIHFEGEKASGPSNENEAHLSRDGRVLYFSSDRTLPVKMPLTREQAKQHLEQDWDDGNMNVWTLPIAPLLDAARSAQRQS